MANGRTGDSRTIWYIVGGIILLLLLAWLFGLFGGGDVEVGEAVGTEESAEIEIEDGEVEVDD